MSNFPQFMLHGLTRSIDEFESREKVFVLIFVFFVEFEEIHGLFDFHPVIFLEEVIEKIKLN